MIIGIPSQVIIVAIRYWNIIKHGYPPAHCDADGEFKSTCKVVGNVSGKELKQRIDSIIEDLNEPVYRAEILSAKQKLLALKLSLKKIITESRTF